MSTSVSPPHSLRVWPPTTTAAETRTPATRSTAISTRVSGPSCRPPPPSNAMAAKTAANAATASGSTATCGRESRRANAPGSAEAACEDTSPEPPGAAAHRAGGEDDHERGERGRDAVPRARDRAEPELAGLDEPAADVHGLRRLAGAGERLLLRGRRARRRVGVRRGRAPRGPGRAAARAAVATAAATARATRSGAGGVVAAVVLPARAQRGQASALEHLTAGGVLVGVRGQRVERLLVLRLRVVAVDVLVLAGVGQQLVDAAFGARGCGRSEARDREECQKESA